MQDLLIQGAKHKGEVSEFFAYYGYPNTAMPKNGYPAVLLIHGGGGTAYPQYIKLWLKQGYAVLALDWYNQRPLIDMNKLSEGKLEQAELSGGNRIRANILSVGKGIKEAILCFTTAAKEEISHKRQWQTIPAQLNEKYIQAELPKKVFQCFLSAYDEVSQYNDLCGSTNLLEFP